MQFKIMDDLNLLGTGEFNKLFLFKGHKYTSLLLEMFPEYESENEQGYTYPLWYERKEALKECSKNLTSHKGRHPAQDAYLTLQQAEHIKNLWLDYSSNRSLSEADYYCPNALENYDLALQVFEDAKEFEFVRGENFAWILQRKTCAEVTH